MQTADLVVSASRLPFEAGWLHVLTACGHRLTLADYSSSIAAQGDVRILVVPELSEGLRPAYESDRRPTLVVVGDADLEVAALEIVETWDDVWREDSDKRSLTLRLDRVLRRARGQSRVMDAMRQWKASLHSGLVAGVLYFDLDHFSQINLRCGRKAGDEILTEVSRRLGEVVSPEDKVVRLRGDEFICLLARSNSLQLLADATRLQACVGATPIGTSGGDLRVTASAGFAEMELRSVEHCLWEAEAASHLAKIHGRNDIVPYATLLEANTDGLTGLYNRRYFDARYKRDAGLFAASGTDHSIALLDLDDFGAVNKRYGHAVGDQVLRKFAEVVRMTIRGADWVARYGGEEFCVVVRGPKLVARNIAERIRRDMEATRILGLDKALISVTVSAGVVNCDGQPTDEVIQRASAALRIAKDAGKNRVSLD